MRNGTVAPQAARPIVKLGAKPKLFDLYTTDHRISGTSPLDDSLLDWANLKVYSRLPVYSEYSSDSSQPLSATLEKSGTPPPKPLLPQPPAPTEPPPSLLFRLVPQLRPLSQAVSPDPHAYPLETRQPTRDPVRLTVSLMIVMPTPPSVNPHNPSEDPFPPVLIGVTHLPLPHSWTMKAKSESG